MDGLISDVLLKHVVQSDSPKDIWNRMIGEMLRRTRNTRLEEYFIGPDDRVIELNRGYVMAVSAWRHEALRPLDRRYKKLQVPVKWTVDCCRGKLYAVRQKLCADGVRRKVYAHMEIVNPCPGYVVDHWNGIGLDNRDANLKIATHSQNTAKAGIDRTVFGVERRNGRFRARITDHGKCILLGIFTTESAAQRAYDRAAIKRSGPFAITNYPHEDYPDEMAQWHEANPTTWNSGPPEVWQTPIPEDDIPF
jgi:hypothetical protein